MKKIPAPRVDDVCQRIRDNWEHLQLCSVYEVAHMSHARSPEVLENLERQTRDRLIVDAMRQDLVLLTAVEVEWLAAPREGGELLPNPLKGVPFDPRKGLESVPEAIQERGGVFCRMWSYALPTAMLRHLPEPKVSG